MSILYDQPYDAPKQSVARQLMKTIVTKDIASAIKEYRALKAGPTAAQFDFAEAELNRLGYQLLQMKRIPDAIEIFKLNVEMFPQASNVYDSLAEAYMAKGEKELSIANYKKSLELDPKNTNATARLSVLTGAQAAVKIDPKLFDSYAGKYELSPNLILTVTNEGGKLMGQPTGQPKFELVPSSQIDFLVKEVNAQITFIKSQDQVTELILNQNGRKMTGKKVR